MANNVFIYVHFFYLVSISSILFSVQDEVKMAFYLIVGVFLKECDFVWELKCYQKGSNIHCNPEVI